MRTLSGAHFCINCEPITMYRLYYYPDNASLAPHILLREAGADHALVLVDRTSGAQKSPEYLALNPAGRIPTLVDGGLVLFESPAICIHIAEAHPESGLIPTSGPDRARFFQWMMYLTNTLQAEVMVYCYPEKHTTDANGAAAVRAAHEARVTDMLALLDRQLQGRTWLVGDRLTACDPFLFMLAHWCARFTAPPLSFPRLGAFMRRMAARTAVQEVSSVEGLDFSAYTIET